MSWNKVHLLVLLIMLIAGCKGSGKTESATAVDAPTDIISFQAAGITVIHKPTQKELASAAVYIKGGTKNYLKTYEGIEHLAFQTALTGGSLLYTPEEFQASLFELGAQTAAYSGLDYSMLSLICPLENFSIAWDQFIQLLINPTFSSNHFDEVRSETREHLEEVIKDPAVQVSALAREHFFGSSAYASHPGGSPASIRSLNADQVAEFYKALIAKNRIFIVITGNFSPKYLQQKVALSLGMLEEGFVGLELDAPHHSACINANLMEASLSENYLEGLFKGPTAESGEAAALSIALSILEARLLNETPGMYRQKEKMRVLYANQKYGYGRIKFNSKVPAERLKTVFEEIRYFRQNGMDQQTIKDHTLRYLSWRYDQLQSSAFQTALIGKAEALNDWKDFPKFEMQLRQLTKAQVDFAFKKYVKNICWTYLGNIDQVRQEDFIRTNQ